MNTGTSSTPASGGRDQLRDSVTFLRTDIEGSTRLLEELGPAYPSVVERHRELLLKATAKHEGVEIDSQGDEFFAAFPDASKAVRAAIDIQLAVDSEPWPSRAAVRVRIGVHTGRARVVGGRYFGLDVHRAARIAAAGSGGQVVLSAATRAQLNDRDFPEVAIRDLGSHRLKDIRYPEVLFDLAIPGLADSFGALTSLDTRPNNLPLLPTTFVGRTQHLAAVRALLLDANTRLLTLTGPGGTGKTRLAIEAVRNVLDQFPHGVFLVQLAPVSDQDLLATTIVQTLHLPQFASKTPLDTLRHYLAQRHILLLLDNFEQIVGAATTVVQLLNDFPKLKVVVTSRQLLNVEFEEEFRVPPLELPRQHQPAPADVESLAAIESVRLVIDRARKYDPHFTLTAENAEAISAICTRLDGLPLALELAASRLRLYEPRFLLKHLGSSLDLLAGGRRDLAPHQRTLKDTIAWSYRLLSADEQLLFRRLSVFRGGCTADQAIAIAAIGQSSELVMNGLESLVVKSLLFQYSVEGEPRLGMLETIREFAAQQLEHKAEDADMRRSHARHYLALAEKMAPRLVGREQRRFVTALLAEEDNLRAAFGWAIEQRDPDTTSRLITALLWMWIPRGQFAEGKAWVTRARDVFDQLGPIRAVALILEAAGLLEVLGGNYERALPLFERCCGIFETLPNMKDRARGMTSLAISRLVLGDPRGAGLSDQTLALYETIDDKPGKAVALLVAGAKYLFSGNAAGASRCYRDALQAFREVDNVFWPGHALQLLAYLRLKEGDSKEAAGLAMTAFEIGREYNYPMIRNLALAVMGAVSVANEKPVQAARFFGAIDASLARLGVTFEPPDHEAMQQNIDATKEKLSAEAYAEEFEKGRQWREPDVVAAVQSLRESPFGSSPVYQ